MQVSSRYKAVLELLELIFQDEKPADGIINDFMRNRKYIGSKDRKFINETVWNIIRHRRRLEFDIGSKQPKDILLCYLKDEDLDSIYDGSQYGLPILTVKEQKLLQNVSEDVYPPDIEVETPKWIYDKVKNDNLLRSLNLSAPADFRINVRNRDVVIEDLGKEGLEVNASAYSPIGIRSLERVNLTNCIAYQEGKIEIQDEASQIASILCDVKANDKIIDYCAGAGGKSLALAYLLDGKGNVDAHDINWHRLEQIKPRLERLNIKNITIKREVTDIDYSVFIIDAPCSGTGTWRRSPDSKFRLTEARVRELNKIQSEILETAYNHTQKGSRLVYITCSILADENEDIVINFLDKHKDISLLNIKNIWQKKIGFGYPCENENMLRLSPLTSNTDGFFMAIMQKQ